MMSAFFFLLSFVSLFLAVGLHSKRMLIPFALNLICMEHPAYGGLSLESLVQTGSSLFCVAGFGYGAYMRAVEPETVASSAK